MQPEANYMWNMEDIEVYIVCKKDDNKWPIFYAY